jgi:PIN domain nuclease of toxin-antitoxin system
MRSVSDYVLDASAVLSLLHREPGHALVASLLSQSAICSVNLCEVASKLADRGLPIASVQSDLLALGFEVISFDESLAFRAAELRLPTRGLGLSLGDRACLATAEARQAVAVTTDRSWGRLKIGARIQVVR